MTLFVFFLTLPQKSVFSKIVRKVYPLMALVTGLPDKTARNVSFLSLLKRLFLDC